MQSGSYVPSCVLAELPVRRLNQLRLCPYTALPCFAFDRWERAVDNVARGDGDEVGRDGNGLDDRMVSGPLRLE